MKTTLPPPQETRELFHVCMVLQGRIDSIWERLVYTHAAVATVMAFLSENFTPSESYLVTRFVVFSFYTVNLAIAMAAMWESYRGLQAGLADLKSAHAGEELSNMDRWMLKLDYRTHPWRRVVLLISVWLVVGYLLFEPVCGKILNPEGAVCEETEDEAPPSELPPGTNATPPADQG